MLEIKSGYLKDMWMFYRQMAGIQSVWDGVQYGDRLRHYAGKGAQVALAFDGLELIGSTVLFKVEDIAKVLGDDTAITSAGARTCVFVAPDHQGKGVSRDLDKAILALARQRGFSHMIGFGYATKEIYDWGKRLSGIEDTGRKDERGRSILIRKV